MDSIRVSEAPDSGSIPDEATTNSMLFYAYVLKSLNFDFYYKGHCYNLEERLQQHNSGLTRSIKPYIPFKIVYFEQFHNREEAIKREKYFKSAAGRRFLKNILNT